jgi:hypothetical protein
MVTKPEFSNQLVLLGASNLTRGLATVLETAQLICGSPTRILVAAGHGRSYGVSSHFLFRSLPGISGCGLWNDLETGPKLPTFALLTDLGNDLAYEKSVDEITGWVLSCIERLAEYQARIIITALPLQNLERLTPTVFGLFRAMFFPRRHLTLQQALDRARAINDVLHRLASKRGITLVEQRPEWYGIDPIHIRRRCISIAYDQILSHWISSHHAGRCPSGFGIRERLRFFHLSPQQRRLLGFDRYSQQPTGVFPDGSTISLY